MKITTEFKTEFVETFIALAAPKLEKEIEPRNWFLIAAALGKMSQAENKGLCRREQRLELRKVCTANLEDKNIIAFVESSFVNLSHEFDRVTGSDTMEELMFWIKQKAIKA